MTYLFSKPTYRLPKIIQFGNYNNQSVNHDGHMHLEMYHYKSVIIFHLSSKNVRLARMMNNKKVIGSSSA